MAKVLEKKPVAKKAEPRKVDHSLLAIERLTTLSGGLVAQMKALSTELDSLKSKVDQVASRLGL